MVLTSIIWRQVVVKLEVVSDVRTHILGLVHQLVQEGNQLHQLVVGSVNKPGLDGDPILQLVSKGLRRVVNDDSLAEVTAQDVEILDVVAVDTDTMLSEQSVLDPIPLGIQEVHQLVSIHLVKGKRNK